MTDDQLIDLISEIADPQTEDPVKNSLITLTLEEMQRLVGRILEAYRQQAEVVRKLAVQQEREACAHIVESAWVEPWIVNRLVSEIRARSNT